MTITLNNIKYIMLFLNKFTTLALLVSISKGHVCYPTTSPSLCEPLCVADPTCSNWEYNLDPQSCCLDHCDPQPPSPPRMTSRLLGSKGNGYTFMDSGPFNISGCNQCITDINNVRTHNKSIIKIFNTLDNICQTFNFTGCVSGLNTAENWVLKENTTKVCQELGYCDTLTIDNYIMSIGDNRNQHLFTYYNRLLAMNDTIYYNNNSLHTNFTVIWEYILNEPLVDISMIPLVTSNRYSLPTFDCGPAKSQNTLLKVKTVNHIDYINLTTIKTIKSFYTSSTYNSFILNSLNYSFMDKIYMNSSIIDSFSNGTDYLVMGNWSNNKLYNLYLVPLINKFI